jgi:hypothetical protein
VGGFNALTQRAARTVFARLGEPARVTPPYGTTRNVHVMVDRDVDLVGSHDELAGRRTLVSLLVEDGPVPQQTEILIGADFSERLVVEQPIDNDGEVIKVAVR